MNLYAFINFCYIILLQCCCYLFICFFAHYLNRIIIIDMYVQFVIVTSYDELITKKFL